MGFLYRELHTNGQIILHNNSKIILRRFWEEIQNLCILKSLSQTHQRSIMWLYFILFFPLIEALFKFKCCVQFVLEVELWAGNEVTTKLKVFLVASLKTAKFEICLGVNNTSRWHINLLLIMHSDIKKHVYIYCRYFTSTSAAGLMINSAKKKLWLSQSKLRF